MKSYVFDTGALAQYFIGHSVVSRIYREVANKSVQGLTCYPLLTELFYRTAQELGIETGQIRFVSIERSLIQIVPLDPSICMDAGKLKVQHNFVSLADVFALSLARKYNATLLTTDGSLKGIPGISVQKIAY